MKTLLTKLLESNKDTEGARLSMEDGYMEMDTFEAIPLLNQLPKNDLKQIVDRWNALYSKWERVGGGASAYRPSSYGSGSLPQSYLNGMNALQNLISRMLTRAGIKHRVGEGDDDTLEFFSE